MFDPVDPNTVYVSFFARGIWRSRDLGDTWEQITPRVGPATGTAERAEFDVVQLGDETRMYVGVGGGGVTRASGATMRCATRRRPRWLASWVT